ncbi:MAG: ATP-NAD kinase family protein, partial [Aestuariivirgaceae bacterium]
MPERIPVGLIVNPIAGMGGSVGLKGTDGAETLQEAVSRGAEPLAARRTKRTLEVLLPAANSIRLLVAPRAMGQDLLEGLGLEFEAIGKISGATSSSADTVAAAKALVKAGARFILFSGGDGTARDLLGAIGDHVPLIGIPCGVKMYSGVFATSPEAAGHLARDFVDLINTKAGSSEADTILAEVMDIDEADYRKGRLSAELFGYARCPRIANRLQGPKVHSLPTHGEAVMSAATEIVELMQPGQVYLVGPGKSAKAVLDTIGLEGTLLGIDAVQDRS